jgi:hypothetical protein
MLFLEARIQAWFRRRCSMGMPPCRINSFEQDLISPLVGTICSCNVVRVGLEYGVVYVY